MLAGVAGYYWSLLRLLGTKVKDLADGKSNLSEPGPDSTGATEVSGIKSEDVSQ